MDTPISLILLSGGLNTRMQGYNKGLLRLAGETFLERIYRTARPLVTEAILVTRQPEALQHTSFRQATDLFNLRSSLTGIHAGLSASRNAWCLVLPCDAPLVKRDVLGLLIARISDQLDAVVPRCGRFYEPLCSVYSKRCLPAVESLLRAHRPKVANLFDLVRIETVAEADIRRVDPRLESFINVNTADDLKKAAALLGCPQSETDWMTRGADSR